MVKLRTLQIWWNEFNRIHFSGLLNQIPIRITRSRRYWGHFSDPPAIYIGRHLNSTPDSMKDTLLHEMIHQSLAQRGIVEQDDHGPIFHNEYLRIVGKEYVDLD